MDAALRKSSERSAVKEENSVESISDHDEPKIFLQVGDGRRGLKGDDSEPFSANQNNVKQVLMTRMEKVSTESNSRRSSPSSQREDHINRLESAKAEMGEVREENQRLKLHLSKIMKDYQTLQMQFHDIVGQETKNNPTVTDQKIESHDDLISLSLGRTSSGLKKDEKHKQNSVERVHDQQDNEGLSLGLQCKFEVSDADITEITSMKVSPDNSLEGKEEEAGESSVAHKGVKTLRSEEDEVAQQNPAKKARVSVRIRCDTPTMNDGCQWRKYGQKIAKGNPCPRAYYRCTVSPACPVRKQVQRCAEDMSILITTYEGTHNHPLPISATAMASTTSAAASMLLSGSSTSNSGTTTIPNFPGLNFYLNDNSKSKPYYLPSSSISSTPSYPTITLDLTSSSSSSHFNKITSSFLSAPRYSSATNLNFSSLESNPLPISWSNGVLNYGTQPYNKSQIGSSLNFGRSPQENLYHSFMQKTNPNPNPSPNPNLLPAQPLPADSIAAATKALTSDPTFQSALAAALKSIIGNTGNAGGSPRNQTSGESFKFGHNINLGDHFPVVSNFPSATSNGNKCATSYISRSSPSTSSQPGSIMFQQPPLPFSNSKSKSTSSADKDHIV